MKAYRSLFYVALVSVMLISRTNGWTQTRPPLKPPPPGVVELTGIPTEGGILDLKDGTLALLQTGKTQEAGPVVSIYRISKEGGKTWGERQPLKCEVGAMGVIRLKSGALGLYGKKGDGWYFSLSRDEGKSWTPGSLIPTYQGFRPQFHSLIQLNSGRLLLTGTWDPPDMQGEHPDLERISSTGWGLWRGKVLFMEGHRGAEIYAGITYSSDDEGQTWKKCNGSLFGWFNDKGVPDGSGGVTVFGESTSAETKDGRVLMLGRSIVGRLVQTYSLDGGQHWNSLQPTELSSSQSPPVVIRIPTNGDLLCVWNQVSGEEIRRGYLRNRLSVAISKDSGVSWEHFKNIEISEGVADVAYVAPEFPIPSIIVGRPGLGQLADGFAIFTYPNVDIVGDKVFIRYRRMWPRVMSGKGETARDANLPLMWPKYEEREAEMTGEGVMRVYPLEWFYK